MSEFETLKNSLYKRRICCVKSCYYCEMSSVLRYLATLFIFGTSAAHCCANNITENIENATWPIIQ